MMLSTKSIPIVKVPIKTDQINQSEESKGCQSSTLSFQPEEHHHLMTQAQQLHEQARKRVKQAEQEAEKLYHQAKKEVDRWKEEAIQQGFEQGFQDGHQQGFEQGFEEAKTQAEETYQVELDRLKKEWLSVNEKIATYFQSVTPELIELMVQAVEKLTFQQFTTNPEVFQPLLENMMLSLGKRQRCLIQVSPEKKDQVEAYLPTLNELAPETRVQVIANALLKPTDCLIETEIESIDLTLDTQLEALRGAWLQAVKQG